MKCECPYKELEHNWGVFKGIAHRKNCKYRDKNLLNYKKVKGAMKRRPALNLKLN